MKEEGYDVADNSYHLDGRAVDLVPTKGKTFEDLVEAAEALKDSGVATKVITYPPKGGRSGHVHIVVAER